MNTTAIDLSDNLSQAALRSLSHLGHEHPEQSLQELRDHLAQHSIDPLPWVREQVLNTRLLCLGERHDFPGRYYSAELITAAAQGGARWLFIEVYSSQQEQIDAFLEHGRHEELPIAAGGDSVVPMKFQRPYVEMMHAARNAGMRIVAIDTAGADMDERDPLMAENVAHYLRDPSERGVAVVGMLHLVPRPLLGREVSMATLLRQSLDGSIVTMARAVPDETTEFSVLCDVANVSEPRLLRTAQSPFATLSTTWFPESMFGGDADHLLFYPARAVLGVD
jgi:hypothetical protein